MPRKSPTKNEATPCVVVKGEVYKKAEPIDPKLQEFMLKLRKKATTGLTWAKLLKAFNVMGWTTEPGVELQRTEDSFGKDKSVDFLVDVAPSERGRHRSTLNRLSLELGAEGFYNWMRDREITSLPDQLDVGEYYFRNITEPKKFKGHGDTPMWRWDADCFIARNGLWVNNPEGPRRFVYIVPLPGAKRKPKAPRIQSDYDFHRWLFSEESGFLDSINVALGMEEFIPGLKRTRENTGTCGVCLKEYKLKHGHLVHHGFERPRYMGYLEGGCPGTDTKPYEKSPTSCEGELKSLKGVRSKQMGQLQALLDGTVDSLPTRGKERIEREKVDKYVWERAYDSAVYQVKSFIKSLDRDIELYEKLVRNWEDVPLPMEDGFVPLARRIRKMK
jgi:hypothetical protein